MTNDTCAKSVHSAMSVNQALNQKLAHCVKSWFKKKNCCISVPPVITPVQTELSVIQGFQALLPCAAQGSPEPRVSWEKDGATVPHRPGKFTALRSGELIVERAEVSMTRTLYSSFNHFFLYS